MYCLGFIRIIRQFLDMIQGERTYSTMLGYSVWAGRVHRELHKDTLLLFEICWRMLDILFGILWFLSVSRPPDFQLFRGLSVRVAIQLLLRV